MRKSVSDFRIEQCRELTPAESATLNALETLTDEQRADARQGDASVFRRSRSKSGQPSPRKAEGRASRDPRRFATSLRSNASDWSLRSRANLGTFVAAAMAGRQVAGAEAELQQAAGVPGHPVRGSGSGERTSNAARASMPAGASIAR